MYEPFGLCGCLCTHFQCGCDKNMVMIMTVVIFRSALGSAFIFIALTSHCYLHRHHQQQYQQEHGHGHPHHVVDRGQLSVLSPSPKDSYSVFIEQYMYVHVYIYIYILIHTLAPSFSLHHHVCIRFMFALEILFLQALTAAPIFRRGFHRAVTESFRVCGFDEGAIKVCLGLWEIISCGCTWATMEQALLTVPIPQLESYKGLVFESFWAQPSTTGPGAYPKP